VDQLGGVMDAVHRAEALAGLERGDAEYRQYTSGSTLGMDVDIGATDKASLKKRVVQWLGLDRDATAMELIDPTTMAGQFVEDLRQAWSIAVLYGPGEALMLPEFLPTFVD
jgi:hypothetical protein